MKEEIKQIYTVKAKQQEAHNVSTLTLGVEKGILPHFIPGQYITVYFPETGTPEGKAYSISNAPGEKALQISVKAIGEFSNRLRELKLGDKITASFPYGYFYSESEETPLVMIAAGIGVAPFRSMISFILKHQPMRKVVLFHSSRTALESVFKKEFDHLARVNKNFEVFYFITREKIEEKQDDGKTLNNISNSRITAEQVLMKQGQLQKPEYFICGSISFTRDLWRGLRALGISEDRIYTEAFFSH